MRSIGVGRGLLGSLEVKVVYYDVGISRMAMLCFFWHHRTWIFAAIILGFIAWYPMAYSPETVSGITKWFILLFGLLSAFFWVRSALMPVPVIENFSPNNQAYAFKKFNDQMLRTARLNKAAAFCAAITAIALANDAYITNFWK